MAYQRQTINNGLSTSDHQREPANDGPVTVTRHLHICNHHLPASTAKVAPSRVTVTITVTITNTITIIVTSGDDGDGDGDVR